MSLENFRKALEKKEIAIGLPPIEKWIGFDNLTMNWICTGSFHRAIPHRRSILIAGETGAGKTMCLLQLAHNAQVEGYHIILLDSETAISVEDLVRNKVDQSDEMMTVIPVTTIDETMTVLAESLKSFSDETKVMFILDSINGLMTEDEDENFDKGKQTNDMGRIVQANKKLLKMIGNRIRLKDWFFLTSAHVYQNQDIRNGKGTHIISQLGSAQYYPSLTLMLTKLDLRSEEVGREQIGIRVDVTTRKNRFFRLGQKSRLELHHDTGFDKYDGVLDILFRSGVVDKGGSWYSYDRIDEDGVLLETLKFQSKNFHQYAEEIIAKYETQYTNNTIVEKDDDVAIQESLQNELDSAKETEPVKKAPTKKTSAKKVADSE